MEEIYTMKQCKVVTGYRADDGKPFTNRESCESYEKLQQLKKKIQNIPCVFSEIDSDSNISNWFYITSEDDFQTAIDYASQGLHINRPKYMGQHGWYGFYASYCDDSADNLDIISLDKIKAEQKIFFERIDSFNLK